MTPVEHKTKLCPSCGKIKKATIRIETSDRGERVTLERVVDVFTAANHVEKITEIFCGHCGLQYHKSSI